MYIPTIGLEIHAHLKTHTKMFCGCPNNFEENNPNVNTCPICLGHPGTLPTMNREAIYHVIKLGLALQGTIASQSHFDRKSYFYPDLPKGYQISQYEEPLVQGGILEGVRITRVHLEEDAGRLTHGTNGKTLVDFNRAGVPLMELVTEPDIHNAEEALRFARELRRILRYLDISDADMEKGQMRVEANISVRKNKDEKFGTKVEVKNLNSFRAVEGAIHYELERQEILLEKGEKVVQETRGWDDARHMTVSQRGKESAHDYRYFPEPDLPPLTFSQDDIEYVRKELPELPAQKRIRFIQEFQCTPLHAEILTEEKVIADYFESSASELRLRIPNVSYITLINYFTSDIFGLMKEKRITVETLKISPEHFAHCISLVEEGTLSSRLAKDLLRTMADTGEDPEVLLQKSGAKVINNEAELEKIIKEIIIQNPKVVEDYKKGKTTALQFFIGQGMAKTKGQANPSILKTLFEKILTNDL